MPPANLGRSLTKRLETIKTQYKRDLVPLTQERETLAREIAELKAVRDVFLEETTVLNARNEELAQLSSVYFRRMEGQPGNTNNFDTLRGSLDKARVQVHQTQQQSISFPASLSASTSGSSTAHEDNIDPGRMGVPKHNVEQHTPSKGFRKWGSKAKGVLSPAAASDRKAHQEHNFQQLSVLRFTRCDHCGDKMWGSQLRCTGKFICKSLFPGSLRYIPPSLQHIHPCQMCWSCTDSMYTTGPRRCPTGVAPNASPYVS